MRLLALAMCLLLGQSALGHGLLATRAADAKEPAWVFLDTPATIDDLRHGDINADGINDIIVLHGRKLWAWQGRTAQLPTTEPTWSYTIPDDVSFLDLTPQGVLCYGMRGMTRWTAGAEADVAVPGALALSWRDPERARFATLRDGHGGYLLPTATGVRWQRKGDAAPADIALATRRYIEASGPFLEDAATAYVRRPALWVGNQASGMAQAALTLFALTDASMVAFTKDTPQIYALPPRPSPGDRRLVDFDGDGRPEMLQRSGNNREGHYAIYRMPTAGTTLEAPVMRLALTGFQLEPEIVDANNDGHADLIVTSIAIDGTNMLRAAASGRVTAETNLFLNRAGKTAGFFGKTPDAKVQSEIGVTLQFSFAGTIDVKRSFTIVTDGDFDGDGYRDLLIRTTADSAAIRAGTQTGAWASEARTLAIPPMGTHPDVTGTAANIDGTPRDELILLYRKAPGGSDRLAVVRAAP